MRSIATTTLLWLMPSSTGRRTRLPSCRLAEPLFSIGARPLVRVQSQTTLYRHTLSLVLRTQAILSLFSRQKDVHTLTHV
eukprot:COSAG05_NODE_10532_length_560_cov_1.433839_1_plen_79_part_01